VGGGRRRRRGGGGGNDQSVEVLIQEGIATIL